MIAPSAEASVDDSGGIDQQWLIIGGAVAGLLVLGLLCLGYRRKKQQEENEFNMMLGLDSGSLDSLDSLGSMGSLDSLGF